MTGSKSREEEEEEEEEERKNGISSCIGRVERRRNLCDRSRNLSSVSRAAKIQKQRSFFPRGIRGVVEARANKVTRGPL